MSNSHIEKALEDFAKAKEILLQVSRDGTLPRIYKEDLIIDLLVFADILDEPTYGDTE
jgi:hypothetical protein